MKNQLKKSSSTKLKTIRKSDILKFSNDSLKIPLRQNKKPTFETPRFNNEVDEVYFAIHSSKANRKNFNQDFSSGDVSVRNLLGNGFEYCIQSPSKQDIESPHFGCFSPLHPIKLPPLPGTLHKKVKSMPLTSNEEKDSNLL